MKGHMRRQREELDARNAQSREQRAAGRPRPVAAPAAPAAPVVQVVADLTDLAGLWQAARNHLAGTVSYLESVLGNCSHIESLSVPTGETVLIVSASQRNFANERARLRLEESLRAVTRLPIRLTLQFAEEPPRAPADPGTPHIGHTATASPALTQRIPPEVVDAVKRQPVVQELMKKLDANIVHIELLGTGDPAGE